MVRTFFALVHRGLNHTLLRLLLAWHDLDNAHVHELVEVLHHACQLCVYGISITIQLANRFLLSETLLFFVPSLDQLLRLHLKPRFCPTAEFVSHGRIDPPRSHASWSKPATVRC